MSDEMRSTDSGMPVWVKAGIVVVLAAAVGFVLYSKNVGKGEEGTPAAAAREAPAPAPETQGKTPAAREAAAPAVNTQAKGPEAPAVKPAAPVKKSADTSSAPLPAEAAKPLPYLVDLGAVTCIPCKMMAPILEELEKEYAGVFDVKFVNVREDESAVKFYRIRVIPTQIFFDAEGNELFRHEGFFAKEDILAKWRELGVLGKQKGERAAKKQG